MRVSSPFFALFRFLLPPAIIVTACLYLYPPFLDCSFPPAKPGEAGCAVPGKQKDAIPAEIAPFRLLTFGDPQLEGDTSLPDLNALTFPSLQKLGSRLKDGDLAASSASARAVFTEDLPKLLQGYRKRLDIWGNDLYLAHIYRSVSWWTQPTHTVVLGDLLGSQWIGDEEFKRRSDRFWRRVFKGAEKVPRAVTDVSGRTEVLSRDGAWKKRVIVVAGNHDIGYAGDLDQHRIDRFEDTFGRVNWEISFKLENTTWQGAGALKLGPSPFEKNPPELRLVIFNSMNLDEPALKPDLLQQSRGFVNDQLYNTNRDKLGGTATVVLTHIPFHKEAGICVDAPFFSYFPHDQGGGIKEQNHLSQGTSCHILSGLAGREHQGDAIVLNGHDHEGCDTYHYRTATETDPGSSEPDQWQAKQYQLARSEVTNNSMVGIREITVRSMMGSFGGVAGFLSGWFDEELQEWKFEYSSCKVGVQHIWWAVHVLDLVVIGLGLAGVAMSLWEGIGTRGNKNEVTKLKKT